MNQDERDAVIMLSVLFLLLMLIAVAGLIAPV